MDSNIYEDDLFMKLVHGEHDDMADFKNMTFTGYEYALNNQKVVSILNFDRSKISIDDNNFKILQDNKPLFVRIKAFCVFIKKGKDLTKNKYIKVKNPLASSKLWDVFSSIKVHIWQETHTLKIPYFFQSRFN